jgi:LemA protein
MPAIVIFAFVFFAVAGVTMYATTLYNGFVQLRVDIDKAWANIDVLLKQRHDEITRLVEVCKGYMQYERETLQAITEARSRFAAAVTIGQKAQASGSVSESVQRLFAAAENYPQLKASETFLQLQKRITDLENQIADRREFYNDAVTHYNIRIQAVPDALMAWAMGLQFRALFQVRPADRATPLASPLAARSTQPTLRSS